MAVRINGPGCGHLKKECDAARRVLTFCIYELPARENWQLRRGVLRLIILFRWNKSLK
jgi:hypothetical protein